MKPILFNTEMVRSILEGRKTVTRRVVMPKHLRVLDSPYHKEHPEVPDKTLLKKLCLPPYQPGDTLWVRETWCKADGHYMYRAFPGIGMEPEKQDAAMREMGLKWCPSIHMPKEAARIFLRVTRVRVERLKDIDGHGILKEGIDNGKSNPAMGTRWENMQSMAFAELWNSTLKPADLPLYGWAANPWVWVIEFERISKDEALGGGGDG